MNLYQRARSFVIAIGNASNVCVLSHPPSWSKTIFHLWFCNLSIIRFTISFVPGLDRSFGSTFIPTVRYPRLVVCTNGCAWSGISGSISSAYGGRNYNEDLPTILSISLCVELISTSILLSEIAEISGCVNVWFPIKLHWSAICLMMSG